MCLLTLIGLCGPMTNGQAITATLFGRILDTSGGSVGKARVTITSSGTGFVRTAQSSDSGEYTIPALPAGEYTVWREDGGPAGQVTIDGGQASRFRWPEVTPASPV